MFTYNGKLYLDRYTLKKENNLSSCKFAAKLRDGEIKRIDNHTGKESYEELHNNTKQFCNKA